MRLIGSMKALEARKGLHFHNNEGSANSTEVTVILVVKGLELACGTP